MRFSQLVVAVLLAPLTASAPVHAQSVEGDSLTFIWHAGDRAELLLRIAQDYTRQTGVAVRGILPPLGDEYHRQIADEFAQRGSAFDLCIFDSQSMSEFALRGYVERLNDRLAESTEIRTADFDALALRRYAEYPENSANFYALPINQDCMGLVYRRDLLEDAKEKAAFRQKYGYDLKVPQTYDELRDIAEFFTRPGRQLYGIAVYGSQEYDACTSAFNNVFWSFGGELWDPKTRKVEGYVNSPQAAAALTYFKALFRFAPPGFENAYVSEVNMALRDGRCALGIQWYYYFDELSAATEDTPQRLGFATLPGATGPDGQPRRFVMVGGQGVSINAFSRNKDAAWKFLEWFFSPEQQWRWVEGGGKTGLSAILNDPKFASLSPGNATFGKSMSLTKDYWHTAAYPQLLAVYQKQVHEALTGQEDVAAALNRCAGEQSAILDNSGDQSAVNSTTSAPKLTVLARLRAKPGKEKEVYDELFALLTPTRAEEGCLNYDMHQSPTDPALFMFHETWETEDHLNRHLNSPHIRAWFVKSQELLAEPVEITRWHKAE